MSEKKTVAPADGEELEKNLDHAEPLYNELVDWMDCVTEETFDSSEMNRMLSALDEADPDPAIDGLDDMDVEASLAKFKREHTEYFTDASAPAPAPATSAAPPAAKKPRSMNRILRVVVPVAAVIAILVGGTIGAQAGGFQLFGMVVCWDGGTFQFRPKEQEPGVGVIDLSNGEEMNFNTLQEALDSLAITNLFEPDMSNYEIVDVVAKKVADELRIRAEYLDGDDMLIIKVHQINNLAYPSIEKNDDDEMLIYIMDGIEHYIMYNYERTKAVWLDGEWECTITGSISFEEMEALIDSIYI